MTIEEAKALHVGDSVRVRKDIAGPLTRHLAGKVLTVSGTPEVFKSKAPWASGEGPLMVTLAIPGTSEHGFEDATIRMVPEELEAA